MKRVRGVIDGQYETTLRYEPGSALFNVRITYYGKTGTSWHATEMNAEEFDEFRRQVNYAWHEYANAQDFEPKPKAAAKK